MRTEFWPFNLNDGSKPTSSTTGKIRWLCVLAIVAFCGVAAVTRWLTKPLPPPVVSLSLAEFKLTPTKTYAVMAMTNLGTMKTYFRGSEWRAEFETSSGRVTSQPYLRRSLPYLRRQGEGHTFSVAVPDGVIRWRVVSSHEWFERRMLRVEVAEWFYDHLEAGRFQDAVEIVLGPLLGHRPEEFDQYALVATPWLTNLPPVAVAPKQASVKPVASSIGGQRGRVAPRAPSR